MLSDPRAGDVVASSSTLASLARSGRPGRPGRLFFARLLAIGLAILLPLLALEGGFRLFGPFLPGEYSLGVEREYDPVLGWRHIPNFRGGFRSSEFTVQVAINSRGLRDEEIPYEKPPGGFRVLALGDSFLAATHVPLEQAMTKQLQGLLRGQLAPRPVDVVNAGVSGYGQAQEYVYLDIEGYKYAPDVVLVVVFLGNDLIDNIRDSDGRWLRPLFELDGDDRLVQVSAPTRPPFRRPPADEFLLRNSLTYNFLQSGVLDKLEQPAEQAGETGRNADREPGGEFQVYERPPSAKLRRSWEVTEALLAAIARRAEAVGARTLVVGAPSFRQLDPAAFDALLAERGLDPRRYDVELPDRRLGEAAARQNLPYLDLLPVFRRAAAGGETVFYPKNTHWAPAGQRTAARAIYDVLLGRGDVQSTP